MKYEPTLTFRVRASTHKIARKIAQKRNIDIIDAYDKAIRSFALAAVEE